MEYHRNRGTMKALCISTGFRGESPGLQMIQTPRRALRDTLGSDWGSKGNLPRDGTLRSPGREESGRPKNPAQNTTSEERPGPLVSWNRVVAACPSNTGLFPCPRRICNISFRRNPEKRIWSNPAQRSGARQNRGGSTPPMQEPKRSCKAAKMQLLGAESFKLIAFNFKESINLFCIIDITTTHQ